MKRLLLVLLVVGVMTSSGWGDWNVGDPAKWVQLPDDTSLGMDVMATSPKVLADDFLCTTPEPITDIHLWGSWFQDILPTNENGIADPGLVEFRLSIHGDIPADPAGGAPYSRPAVPSLWEMRFLPGTFTVRPYLTGLLEGWYNPNTGEYVPEGDTVMWQYNFLIDEALAFQQEGTTSNPIVYWLDVEAFPVGVPGTAEPLFGWKTSLQHWNDDAVWGDSPDGPWQELRYPSAHPLGGESIDLAFVITPEPVTAVLLGMGGLALLRKRR